MRLYQVTVEKRAVVAAGSMSEAERVARSKIVDAPNYETDVYISVTDEIYKEEELEEGWDNYVPFSIDDSVVKNCGEILSENITERKERAADKAAAKYQLFLPHVYE